MHDLSLSLVNRARRRCPSFRFKAGGTGTVAIAGSALFATPTGLFFNFGESVSSFVKFERITPGQVDTFFCLDAGGADCSGTQSDVAVAIVCFQFDFCGGVLGRPKSDLANLSNYPGILSETGVLQLAEVDNNVGQTPVPPALPLFLTGLLGLAWATRRAAAR
jgi:hypothetical protein